MQSQFAVIANASVLLVPEIPAQAHPWNNEYTLSISTQYTEHGTLRSGIYGRKLRSPLTLTNFGHPHPPEVGILTGSADAPYVSVPGFTGSAVSSLEIRVNSFADLVKMARNVYSSRVVDVLEVRV